MSYSSSFINRFYLVKQIPVFSKLNLFELRRVASKSILVEHRKGDMIRREGDPPDFFYCLISGRLQSYTLTSQGIKENVEFIRRGMIFGIVSLLTGKNHSLNFEAMNDSVVLKIPKDEFHEILKLIPKLGVTFSQILSQRIRTKVKGSKTIFESTIISTYSPMKGTGSSTYAINLALSLAEETRKKVILIHIDAKEHTARDRSIDDVQRTFRWKRPPIHLNEILEDQQKIREGIITGDLKIDLLNVIFDSEDDSLRSKIGSFVGDLVGDYHYVVVDLPNEMDDVVLETLTQSDVVHLLTLDRQRELASIRKVIDRLENILKDKFTEERIRVIISAIHSKVYLSFEEINKTIDYHVYTMLPHMMPMDMKIDHYFESLSFPRCQKHSAYDKVVTRIAREIGGVLVGLVLGGGAALGVAHVGVLRVLEQERIPIDVVVGSSMGALIGSLWATGKKADEIEKLALEFERKVNLMKLLDPVVPISGFIGGHAIKRWLRKSFGNRTFYSTKVPLKIVAYDLVRRDELVINGGPIVDAVRKSISIPGIMEPVKNKEQLIIDGGVMNPLPVNVLAGLGIKKIIAVNVLQSPEDVSKGYDLYKQRTQKKEAISFLDSPGSYLVFRCRRFFSKIFKPSISDIIVLTLQAAEYVIAEQSAQQADINIHPDLVGVEWYELYRAKELIQRGEKATRQLIPQIKSLVQE